ncbi:MAG: exosortase/archaeosortase family protein [Candidatus Micrarchaeota archaeon]
MQKTRAVLEAIRFVTVFLAVSFVAWLVLSATALPNVVAAHSSNALLSLFGTAGQVSFADGVPHLVFAEGVLSSKAVDAEVSGLCSGALELAVLLGIIAASEDRSWRKRVLGALGAVAVVLVFNPLRIAVTLLYADSAWLSAVHEVGFRVSLVVLIVFYYAVWYHWLSGGDSVGARRFKAVR